MRSGSLLDFAFKSLEPILPMATVGIALSAFAFRDARQQQLVGIELGIGLGDPLALLVEQFGQQFRFCLTAFGKLDFDLGKTFLGDPFEMQAPDL